MSNLTVYQADAFAERPFTGNPAGVCITDTPLADDLMQSIALEMNLSETAFLVEGNGGYSLRWFTPFREVELCGHATLASAHVLWETGRLSTGAEAAFDTRSGRLTARRRADSIVMDFPAEEPEPVVSAPAQLRDAIPAQVVEVGRNRLDYLVVLESEDAVRHLTPNFGLLAELQTRGVIVTAPSQSPDYDFVSRYFAPRFGIPEDPVTGSAHCCLGPYWCGRMGRNRLVGYQASPRGGVVEVALAGPGRVEIAGTAVTTARIEMVSAREAALSG